MRRAIIGITRAVLQGVYNRAQKRTARQDEVLFVSRQTETPSYDYAQVARAFEQRGWTVTMHLKKVRMRNLVAYAGHMLREAKLLARCKVAVLDRYDPVVSLLTFESTRAQADDGAIVNVEFPTRPLIMQMWHAFGAFKKFGFQSVDTPEGHSAAFTSAFDIHRNYSWVVCSGEACRAAFAEAFARPVERVVALDRPEYDELVELGRELAEARARDDVDARAMRVLMAPTLRINADSAHPFRDLYERRTQFESRVNADFTWTFHPLEENAPAPGNASDALLECDCVVTDYSSIVYEAHLLGKAVFFYTPDLESYLASPGLNVNPAQIAPAICALSEEELASILNAWAERPQEYPHDAMERFAGSAFDERDRTGTTAAERFADFAIAALPERTA